MSHPAGLDPAGADPQLGLGPVPAVAGQLFGDRLALAQRYATWLAGDGVVRGLIGPREVPRIWLRHIVNSVLLSELLPAGARLIDIGSGAGLPGVPLAIGRPDLTVVLVEPMLRRTNFLSEIVEDLGLGATVSVVRGRAEDAALRRSVAPAGWVTARAVAPLDRLARWGLPLVSPGGRLLAMKGATASTEVATHQNSLRRLGAGSIEVLQLGAESAEPTWVVSMERVVSRSGRKGSNR